MEEKEIMPRVILAGKHQINPSRTEAFTNGNIASSETNELKKGITGRHGQRLKEGRNAPKQLAGITWMQTHTMEINWLQPMARQAGK